MVAMRLKHDSRCPFMRLCVFVVTLLSLVSPAKSFRAALPAVRGDHLAKQAAAAVASGRGCTGRRGRSVGPQELQWLCGKYGLSDRHRTRVRLARMVAHAAAPEVAGNSTPSGPSEGKKLGNVLILGAGWVGSRLANMLHENGAGVVVTNRPGEKTKPPYFAPAPMSGEISRTVFELNDDSTWDRLPDPSTLQSVVITFALNSKACEGLWERYLSKVPQVVCYSSTSVYQVDTPGQRVTEKTPLRTTGRAAMEAQLQDRGATVLTISGIFGEPRSPRGVCACLTAYSSAGGTLNARSRINMVHVDDILAATRRTIELGLSAQRINVAGEDFALAKLCDHCKHPPPADSPTTDLSSKVVVSDALLRHVMPEGYAFTPPM